MPILQLTKMTTLMLIFIGISCFGPSFQNSQQQPDAVFDGLGRGKNSGLPGHMQPLGSHRPPDKPGIDVLDTVPDPVTFYDNYVKNGWPVLLRGAAKNMLAFQLWTDEYLR